MSSITTGGKTTTYAYDADGIRTTKVVGGVTHEYLTLNGKVVYEKIGTGNTAKIMVFTYDAQGRPFAVKYSKNNGDSFTNYFYALNLQGDVVKIFRPNAVKDADGTTIGYTERTYATYSYNAWGELTGITDSNGNSILNKQTTSTALANLNPLRYRGYYYDNDTGFYYLQSRYYDPANRRFINADVFTSTDSTDAVACNMFAYCGNNPENFSDSSGYERAAGFDPASGAANAVGIFGVSVASLVLLYSGYTLVNGTAVSISKSNSKTYNKAKTATVAKVHSEKQKIKVSYWAAEIQNKKVVPLFPLRYPEAQIWVASGNNLLCIDSAAAYGIVKFWPSAIWEPRHGCATSGYLNHYHLSTAHGNHIWYYGD